MRILTAAVLAAAMALAAPTAHATGGAAGAPAINEQAWRPSAVSEKRWGLTQADWLTRSSQDLVRKAKRSRYWKTVQVAADEGDSDAAALIAFDLQNANSDGKVLAARYADKAAAGGNPRGMSYYGLALSQGVGVEKNLAEAEVLLVRARDLGNIYALAPLGKLYFDLGGDRQAEAAELYRLSAEAGLAEGMAGYAWFLETGKGGVAKDPGRAVAFYEKASEAGLSEYFVAAANIMQRGDLGEADPSRAAEYLQRGAAEGDALAMARYAHCLAKGYGVDKNVGEALDWAAKSAGAGNVEGKYTYASLLLAGTGGAGDPARGRQLMLEAANAGNSDAAFELALMAFNGSNGAAQDDALALKYFMLSSKAGNASATFNVGVVYESHLHDRERAKTWYRKAKDLGYEKADVVLARLAQEDRQPARKASVPVPTKTVAQTPPTAVSRSQALVDANGAPTAAGILATSTALAAKGVGKRQTATPGEIIVSVPFYGDSLRLQRSIDGVSCRKKAKGVYRCSYNVTVETLPVEGNSFAAFASLLSVGFSRSLGTNVSQARSTYDFIRKGSGWSSPALDAAFRQDAAASARQRGSSAGSDLDDARRAQEKTNQDVNDVVNNLRDAYGTKY
jgi:TPR repeat protein